MNYKIYRNKKRFKGEVSYSNQKPYIFNIKVMLYSFISTPSGYTEVIVA